MAVISLVSKVALLNNGTGVISSSSKGKIAARDLLLEMVAGGILLIDGLSMIGFKFGGFKILCISDCVLESLWVHWAYVLENATAQSMDKLV
ncbi:hypothetical protein G9A89_016390 [Geosiphon pyriformis]|nr:hypothetical protein G9A89_016390 [Geosiphon pyriformis]